MKKYKGFTLVELLIVMGIIAVLAVLGIAVARFAIQRSNNIQHADAVRELVHAVTLYHNDYQEYPDPTSFTELVTTLGTFTEAFDPGANASYYYFVSTDKQKYLICVSYGGWADVDDQGGYCDGEGIGKLPEEVANRIDEKQLANPKFTNRVELRKQFGLWSNWDSDAGIWNGAAE